MNTIQEVYFKVDKRAVRDRYNFLSKGLRNKLKGEEKEIETDMTEVEMHGTRRIKICILYYPSHTSRTFRTLRTEILDSSKCFLHTTK